MSFCVKKFKVFHARKNIPFIQQLCVWGKEIICHHGPFTGFLIKCQKDNTVGWNNSVGGQGIGLAWTGDSELRGYLLEGGVRLTISHFENLLYNFQGNFIFVSSLSNLELDFFKIIYN